VNEHYCDVMGNLAFPDSPATEWFVGETATGGAGSLRDMTSPGVSNYAAYSRRGAGCDGVAVDKCY
jgi:Zn-dependent metalloprotease